MFKFLRDLGQGRGVVPRQPNLLPELRGEVGPFDRLDHQIAPPVDLPDRRVSTIREGTGRLVAQPSHVHFISTEVLSLYFCPAFLVKPQACSTPRLVAGYFPQKIAP